MNERNISLLLFSILLSSGFALAQDELPIYPPPGYFGSLTIDGQPAPPGTTITAKIAGEVRGSLTTSKAGSYGDPVGPVKLWITGYQNEIGQTVTFYVNDIAAGQTTFTGGETVNEIDLTFTGVAGASAASGSGGGGSGEGGGGVISGEPLENINFFETLTVDLFANRPAIFRFTDTRLTVYEIVVTSNVDAKSTTARVEHLKGQSRLATSPPSGDTYENVDIWFGIPNSDIKDVIIRFRVANTWLSSEEVDPDEVMMHRWNGREWVQLDTAMKTQDETYTNFETITNGFSPYAISGVGPGASPTSEVSAVTPEVTATPGITPAEDAVKSAVSLYWILYVMVAIVIIVSGYFIMKRRK